jgi:hypothetical protein
LVVLLLLPSNNPELQALSGTTETGSTIDADHAGSLILDFPASRSGRKKY